MPETDIKQHCNSCSTIADCKQAFGAFWGDKSRGGTGCSHPFTYRHKKDRPRYFDYTANTRRKLP